MISEKNDYERTKEFFDFLGICYSQGIQDNSVADIDESGKKFISEKHFTKSIKFCNDTRFVFDESSKFVKIEQI